MIVAYLLPIWSSNCLWFAAERNFHLCMVQGVDLKITAAVCSREIIHGNEKYIKEVCIWSCGGTTLFSIITSWLLKHTQKIPRKVVAEKRLLVLFSRLLSIVVHVPTNASSVLFCTFFFDSSLRLHTRRWRRILACKSFPSHISLLPLFRCAALLIKH